MLNVIVEKLTGKPFLEYLKERFLVKVGFSLDAYCLQCPGGHSFGDSGIVCTARDLLIFARFVVDGGVMDGVRYMNEEYLMQAPPKNRFQTGMMEQLHIIHMDMGIGFGKHQMMVLLLVVWVTNL